jgi:hypothetical protein
MQTNPPVLPCLQTIGYESKNAKAYQVDGWDCWFYKDLNNLVSRI